MKRPPRPRVHDSVLMLRVTKELHERLLAKAAEEGMSMSLWIRKVLTAALAAGQPAAPAPDAEERLVNAVIAKLATLAEPRPATPPDPLDALRNLLRR